MLSVSVTGKRPTLTLILIKKVDISKEIILIGSYCPSKTINCNIKDNLWLMDRIKTFIEEKKRT